MGRADARADAGLDAGRARASVDADVTACSIPPDCLPVRSTAFTMEPCCDEAFGCGFDYGADAALPRDAFYAAIGAARDARCIPMDKLFHSSPTNDDLRVLAGDGGQVLIASACPTEFITSMPFTGCCLPSNECALSTHPIQAELGVLAGGTHWPFSKLECVPSEELNAQLRGSPLAGFAKLPSTSSRCDYAELDRTLAPAGP
jgi:hypothetical protein